MLFLIALWLQAVVSTSQADFFTHLWETRHEAAGHLRLAPELTYYSSGSNYTGDGSRVTPTGLNRYYR